MVPGEANVSLAVDLNLVLGSRNNECDFGLGIWNLGSRMRGI